LRIALTSAPIPLIEEVPEQAPFRRDLDDPGLPESIMN
jgi:hypothetical protein